MQPYAKRYNGWADVQEIRRLRPAPSDVKNKVSNYWREEIEFKIERKKDKVK